MLEHTALRVLVVEDDQDTILLMQATLINAGYCVDISSDYQSAIKALQNNDYAIIILDIILPDGNGFDICRSIRNLEHLAETPVLIATGLDDLTSIQRGYDAGATDFITKPINWGTLPFRIQYILGERETRGRLSVSESKTHALLFCMPDTIIRLCFDGKVIDFQASRSDDAISEALEKRKIISNPYLLPEIFSALMPALLEVQQSEFSQPIEFQWSPDTAQELYWEARVFKRNEKEAIVIVRDITARRRQDLQLRLWAKVFENGNEAILITDSAYKIVSVNLAFTKITGFNEDEVLHADAYQIGAKIHTHGFFRNLVWLVKENGSWQGELQTHKKNGEKFTAWYSIATIKNAQGEADNYICLFSDITETKRSQQKIEHLAHHDILTDLPNRLLLHDRLEMAISTAKRQNEKIGVLFVDLDRFKNINDSLGHDAGDKVLKLAAHRLRSLVRTVDTVARLGGDEFVIVLPNIHDENDVGEITQKLCLRMSIPYKIENLDLHLTPSIGVSLYPSDGATPQELIKNADAAMYLAKEQGRNNFQFYKPALNARTLDRLRLESDLRQSILENQFQLYFQPQVDALTLRVIGAEALIRWNHPRRGLVPPNDFISIAEETGLIISLGEWVIAEAARSILEWRQLCDQHLVISVNISTIQFRQANFAERVRSLLGAMGVAPHYFELEITESTLMHDMPSSIAQLKTLREAGFRIAIDDFGTGFSSLNYLRHLPIDILKIDQSFVRDMMGDDASKAIVKTIINLAESLGKTTVAEGVETEQQLHLLTQMGCNLIQGYHIEKPLPPSEFKSRLEHWKKSNWCHRPINV
ncbi:MAG: hypothetical protein RL497_483 [Pseudomonadota bacterium]|jgi:diguanylate cyclase (GGDEF)-like protein/PAS domain S-box-containing protein